MPSGECWSHCYHPRPLWAVPASGRCGALAAVLDFVREGDTLVVSRIDHLARDLPDRSIRV